jgi:pyridoxine/pyridoxamine 5'-phosphate oxidase
MAELTEEARRIIEEAGPALIATSSKNGKSNVQVKGLFRILDDEHVFFIDIDSPRTVADLRDNPQLSALVFDPNTGRSCRVWGKTEIFNQGELFDSVAAEFGRGKTKVKHVVLVTVGEVEVF